ncbi:hypothetical protein ASD8599_00968 [Ascidiaceihabitans donghaensis]|uniref:Uncharacterized protein n=1 Tax=Ascidiaceihabitans donghaensis TaxID=1510460 RepID=A0A2R8BAY0_9RHOB|nr:hypothetical protein ASD8599_00968 [Ascidiaceihabitans donghaensis]
MCAGFNFVYDCFDSAFPSLLQLELKTDRKKLSKTKLPELPPASL